MMLSSNTLGPWDSSASPLLVGRQFPETRHVLRQMLQLPPGKRTRKSGRKEQSSKKKIFRVRQSLSKLYERLNRKCIEQFSFTLRDVTYSKFVDYLHTPKDPSSLAVTRILFGVCMLFDIPDERGGAMMKSRWGNPDTCHFPLIPFVTAVPMPYMALVYLALWLGALGITLGYKYYLASWTFTIAYWYLFLIEKSFWNNHSYLFGLVSFLLSFTQAGCFWSVDAYLDPSLKKTTVPYWNYFVLKYQFFILYFMAGIKKGTAEWLTGYSVNHLSEHWVFAPFKLFLTARQINYLIVHWFIFVFDLTIAFWMMYSKTRHIAMVFCGLFHLMNIRLFSIGMFPWVCLSTMPLFYAFDWPKKVYQTLSVWLHNKAMLIMTRAICIETQTNKQKCCKTKEIKDASEITKDDLNSSKAEPTTQDKGDEEKESKNVSKSQGTTILLILLFVFSQAFLPFSHFITKGYNNWTNGLYGYSWDMMVHTWDVNSVVIKIVDNTNQAEYYLDPYIFTPNNRWTRYGDMIHQYAHCLKDKFASKQTNISIYFDIWCSLNGRFTQRMFDDKIDMLNVSWSPFRPVSYLMPLLSEGYSWRKELQDIEDDVNSWNNNSDVLFVAEFPGYEQYKFIPKELVDVKLTALKGDLLYEIEMRNVTQAQLSPGMKVNITSNMFHRVKNTGSMPAFYMYTFTDTVEDNVQSPDQYLPIANEISRRFRNYILFINNLMSSLSKITECQ